MGSFEAEGVSLGVTVNHLYLFGTTEVLKTACIVVQIKAQFKLSFLNRPELTCPTSGSQSILLPYMLLVHVRVVCHYLHLLIIKVNDRNRIWPYEMKDIKLGGANSYPSFLKLRCKCKMHIALGFCKVQIPAHSILILSSSAEEPSTTTVLTTFQYPSWKR